MAEARDEIHGSDPGPRVLTDLEPLQKANAHTDNYTPREHNYHKTSGHDIYKDNGEAL